MGDVVFLANDITEFKNVHYLDFNPAADRLLPETDVVGSVFEKWDWTKGELIEAWFVGGAFTRENTLTDVTTLVNRWQTKVVKDLLKEEERDADT